MRRNKKTLNNQGTFSTQVFTFSLKIYIKCPLEVGSLLPHSTLQKTLRGMLRHLFERHWH